MKQLGKKVLVFLQEGIMGRFINDGVFGVAMDYNQTIAEMIAAGNYEDVHSEIIEARFPMVGTGRKMVEIHLIRYFGRDMRAGEVLWHLDKMGYRSAMPAELLALAAQYPNLQRGRHIVALDPIFPLPGHNRRDRYVLSLGALGSGEGKRFLTIDWFGNDWYAGCHFAAVRKI